MNNSYNYFNNEELWDSNHSIKEVHRIKKIISIIPDDAKSLLDAGCGDGILVNKLLDNNKLKKIYGLDISDEALKYVKSKKIKGEITNLPFNENEFDVVTSLEVLEHLSVVDYEKALAEISRVSKKYIIISVPNNEKLEDRFIQCNQCKSRFHFTNHVRSFDEKMLLNLFSNHNYKCVEILNIGRKTNFKLISGIKRILKKKNAIKHSHKVICPSCNNVITPNRKKAETQEIKKGDQSYIINHLQKIWPVNEYYDWFAALYKVNH